MWFVYGYLLGIIALLSLYYKGERRLKAWYWPWLICWPIVAAFVLCGAIVVKLLDLCIWMMSKK